MARFQFGATIRCVIAGAAFAGVIWGCGSSSKTVAVVTPAPKSVFTDVCVNSNGAARFQVQDMGAGITPVAVNASGQIIALKLVNGINHGVIFNNGVSTDLGGGNVFPTALNKSGQVVGYSGAATPAAFSWLNGKMTTLQNLPGGSQATPLDINSSGVIVGFGDYGAKSGDGSPLFHAVVWPSAQSAPRDLGVLTAGDEQALAESINDSGKIVGSSGLVLGAQEYWSAASPSAQIQDLGYPAGKAFSGGFISLDRIAIGNSGLITLGTFVSSQSIQNELVLLRPGSAPQAIPSLEYQSKPDDTDQFTCIDTTGATYLYETGKGAQSLTTMLPANCSITLGHPLEMANGNLIISPGAVNGVSHGFLITP